MEAKGHRQSEFPQWVSWLMYAFLAVLMTWPLATHLSTHLNSTDTDVFNVYWGNWWVRTALSRLQNPYVTKYLIYPTGFNLVTFAFSPFLALLALPLNGALPPIVAYNVLVWATIVLCCVAMDQLVRYLTGNAWAALVAGIVFGFAPAIVAERSSHLNMSMVAWIPWSALLLTRLMREARLRHAFLLAVAIALAFLTRPQVGALVLLFDGVYWIGLALSERRVWHEGAGRRLLLAGVLSVVFLAPFLIQVQQALGQPEAESLLRWDAEDLQTDLLAYALPPSQHPLFGSLTQEIYEHRFQVNTQFWAYVGFIPLLLAIYAAKSHFRKAQPWLSTSLFFFVLALGPYLRINGKVYTRLRLPYGWAPRLFSIIGINEPNRFNLALMAGLAVLVGLASAHFALRLKKPWIAILPALLIVGEYLVAPVPLMAAPSHSAFYDQMSADSEKYAIVDLPLTREAGEIHRYYQTIHQKPIVGGWDHRVPPDAFAFMDSNPLLGTWLGNDGYETTLDNALAALAQANVRYFVFHKDQLQSMPPRMKDLLLSLKPLYEDSTVVVLPVEASSGQEYNIVHQFGPGLGLLPPITFLALPMDGGAPQLSLATCWFLEQQSDAADRFEVRLKGPDGSVVYTKTMPLAPLSPGLMCERDLLEISPPMSNGIYDLLITPFAKEEPLGTWRVRQPIHVLEDRAGDSFAAMGFALATGFDAPMELLGYNLVGGDGFVWVDLYWRSLANHDQAYLLNVQLLDPETGQIVASQGGLMPKLAWREGDLYQERRVLWINDVPQGQYAVGVTLGLNEKPDGPIPAFDEQSGEPWPGSMARMDVPVLILPAALEGLPSSGEGRLLAYSSASDVAADPEDRSDALFGGVGRLVGYRIEPKEAKVGQELDLTLYWVAAGGQPRAGNYTAFVHVLDESGQLIAQHDGLPANGLRPTRTWREGDLIIDTHRIEWKTAGYVGKGVVEVGMYDTQTQERVPVYGADGQCLADDRLILGEIPIK